MRPERRVHAGSLGGAHLVARGALRGTSPSSIQERWREKRANRHRLEELLSAAAERPRESAGRFRTGAMEALVQKRLLYQRGRSGARSGGALYASGLNIGTFRAPQTLGVAVCQACALLRAHMSAPAPAAVARPHGREGRLSRGRVGRVPVGARGDACTRAFPYSGAGQHFDCDWVHIIMARSRLPDAGAMLVTVVKVGSRIHDHHGCLAPQPSLFLVVER